jgi:hypothetical protein
VTTTHDTEDIRDTQGAHDAHDEGGTSTLPPFVFVPDDATGRHVPAVEGVEPPPAGAPVRPRRWSTGHSVAAAVVAVGVLASGGVALAARDGGTGASTVPGAPGNGQQGQFPGGQLPGQTGQLPGQTGQLPGQLPGQGPGQPGGGFGHDDDGGVTT